MFNWLQNRFQKHFQWIFITAMVLVCISFIFTVGNFSGIDAGARAQTTTLDFYGYNLESRKDVEPLSQGAELYAFLEKRNVNPAQREQLIMQRAALLWLADQMQIGDPSPEQSTEYLHSRPLFLDAEGKFNAEAFTTFIDQVENNPEFSKEEFAKALLDSYRIDQANQALAGPGFALGAEASDRLQQQRTEWSTFVASVDASSFTPELSLTDEALEQYYQENKIRYTIAEQTQASYVVFESNAIVATLPQPSTAELQTFFELNRFRFEKKDPLTEPASPDNAVLQYEDVDEALIIVEYLSDQAKPITLRKADAFLSKLNDERIAYDSEEFHQALAAENLTLSEAAAFSSESREPSPLPTPLKQQLSSLISTRYFSDVYPSDSGAIVGFRQGTTPSRIPELAEIKEELSQDWQKAENARLFAEHSEKLQKELASALAAGTAFPEAAEALALTVQEFSNFTEQQLPTGMPYSLLNTLKKTATSSLSTLVRQDGKSYWLYPTAKNAPTIASDDSELKSTLTQIKNMNQQFNNYIMLNELIQAGFAPSEIEAEENPTS